MTDSTAAKKATTALTSDRVHVTFPATTAVGYINDNDGGEGYEGWLARVAGEAESQEDCGALELANGEDFLYGDDIHALAIDLQSHARLLHFEFIQIIELTEHPLMHGVVALKPLHHGTTDLPTTTREFGW